jgi:hypothetical protein
MTAALMTLEPEAMALPPASAVDAIHTTSLKQALFFFAKLVRLDHSGVPARVTITCGDARLHLHDAHIGAVDRRLGFGDSAVRLNTPSVRHAHDALMRSGARMVDDLRELSPEYAAFRIADADGNLVEISGRL